MPNDATGSVRRLWRFGTGQNSATPPPAFAIILKLAAPFDKVRPRPVAGEPDLGATQHNVPAYSFFYGAAPQSVRAEPPRRREKGSISPFSAARFETETHRSPRLRVI